MARLRASHVCGFRRGLDGPVRHRDVDWGAFLVVAGFVLGILALLLAARLA